MCQQVDGAWSVEAEKFVSHASRSKTDVACAIKLWSGSIGQSLTCAAVMTGQCDPVGLDERAKRASGGRASEASEGGSWGDGSKKTNDGNNQHIQFSILEVLVHLSTPLAQFFFESVFYKV